MVGFFASGSLWYCVCGMVDDLVIIPIGIVFSPVMWVEINLSMKVSESKLLRLNLTIVRVRFCVRMYSKGLVLEGHVSRCLESSIPV